MDTPLEPMFAVWQIDSRKSFGTAQQQIDYAVEMFVRRFHVQPAAVHVGPTVIHTTRNIAVPSGYVWLQLSFVPRASNTLDGHRYATASLSKEE